MPEKTVGSSVERVKPLSVDIRREADNPSMMNKEEVRFDFLLISQTNFSLHISYQFVQGADLKSYDSLGLSKGLDRLRKR